VDNSRPQRLPRRALSVPRPNVPGMTNTRNNDGSTALAAAVAPARARHRELIDAAVEWLADRGRAADPDHLALICAGAEYADGFVDGEEVHPTRWTRLGVYHVLRCDIPNWCSMQGCRWPLELPQEMWSWFDFLHGTGRLDPASDPVAELRKPLACYGWLDQDGAPLPPDAQRWTACECLLPYRETTELLSELVRMSERFGEDPLDRLRWLVGRPPRWPLTPRPGGGPEDGTPPVDLDGWWWAAPDERGDPRPGSGDS
jgi:hypothetical protein